jgi:hypothetical protein
MMAWWKWPLRFALVAALAIAFQLFWLQDFDGPLEYAVRYLNFSTLAKERLIRETKVYIREIARSDQMACLYIVQCDGERARLELVSDVAGWDFQVAKDRIWRRRFSNYCPGRTTNFGLHLIPRAGPAGHQELDRISHARWSFLLDQFLAEWTHFQGGGSFTDQPWSSTPERAIVR